MSALNAKWILMCKIMKPLSHSGRLKLLDALDNEDKGIEQLSLKSKMSQTVASRHLRALQNTGLVNRSKRGQQVYYKMDKGVCRFAEELRKMAVCILKKQFRS